MSNSNRSIALSLTAILVLIIGLRFYGIFQGLPSDVSDEVGGVASILLMASQKSLAPNPDGAYTSLYNYFVAIIYGALFLGGKLIGRFHDKYDFALLYVTNPWLFFITVRIVSFASGVGALWYSWKSGRLLTGSRLGGLLAALVLGLSVVHTYMSMVGKVDAMMVFFVAAYLYQVVKILKGQADIRTCCIAGILFGLAVASKLNAALLAPALPLALLIRQVQVGNFNRQDCLRLLNMTIIFGSISVLFFLIGNPAFVVDPIASLKVMSLQSNSNKYVVYSVGGVPTPWVWVFKDLIFGEGAVGIVIIFSLLYSVWLIVRKKRYELILPLLFIAGFIAYVGSWTRASLHYMMPVYPLFALVAAVMLVDLIEGAETRPLRKAIGVTAIILLVAFGFWKDAGALIDRSKESTRIAAKNWIENNIPRGSLISYDDYAASPPFFSPDIYLNSGTKLRYENFVPEPLKEKILSYAATHTSFRSMRLRRYLDKPVFPTSWSPEELEKNEKDFNLNHYYRMQFYSLDDLYHGNVEYIVVCQGYYSQFYNVVYPPENPLYDYHQKSLNFYKEIFAANRYYTKVAEFNPSDNLSGKTITIFRKKAVKGE